MTGPSRLALFAVLLVAVFAGATVLGDAVDPASSGAGEDHAAEGDAGSGEHGGGHAAEEEEQASEAALPGLAIAQDGYRLVLQRSSFEAGARAQRFEFRIVDPAGRPVRDFEVEHAKRMHFIVARRDMADFQHLHPTMRADGTWTQAVRFARGGSYRVFTDFTREGAQHTLGADVQVAGGYRPGPLASAERTIRSDGGLEVTLRAAAAHAGREERVAFDVRERGRLVNDRLERYLGATGHLVALREGDLAYLHTHPEGDELAFATSFPSAGAYRLFVQFSYQGRVHTAAFTRRVSP